MSLNGPEASDYGLAIQAPQAASITPKALTETGLAVPASKVYDGTTTATVSGNAALQNSETPGTGTTVDGAPYTNDQVSISGSATGTYNTKDVATANKVTFGAIALSGAQATDYSLTVQGSRAATITPKTLTEAGLSVPASKVYDATTTATVNGTPALQTTEAAGTGTTADGAPYTNDTVSISGTPSGTYNSKDVATANKVTFGAMTLSGAQASNYSLALQAAQAATITAKTLTETGLSVPLSKIYDATTVATVNGSAALQAAEAPGAGTTSDGAPYSTDFVTIAGTALATYNSKDVPAATQAGFSGISLTGPQASDYSLAIQAAQAATIVPKTVMVMGLTPNNKVYDGTTAATFAGTAALLASEAPGTGSTADFAPYSIDTVSANGTIVGTFASPNVGSSIAVTVTGGTLAGAQAADYVFAADQETGLAANITPATLTYNAAAASRTYGAANPVLSGTVTGFVNGETQATATAGTLAFASGAVTTSVVGTYPISGSGLTAGNYVFTQAAVNANALTITTAPLSVTPNNKTRKYGAANPVLDGVVTGLVAGDVITGNFATTAAAASSVGPYTVTVASLNDAAGRISNYTVTNNTGTLTVQPADSQVGPVNIEFVANGNGTPQFTVTSTIGNASGSGGSAPNGNLIFNDCVGTTCAQIAKVALSGGSATTSTLTLASNSTPHVIQVTYDQSDPNFAGPAATAANVGAVAVLSPITTSAGAAIPVQTIPVLNPTAAANALTYINITCEVESGGFPVSNTICTPSPTAVNGITPGSTFSLQVQIGTKGSTGAAQPAGQQSMNRMRGLEVLALSLPAIVFLPLGAPARLRRRLLGRRMVTWLGLGVLILSLLMSISCGGNGFGNPNSTLQPSTGASSATPVGSYLVQVTGTNSQSGQTTVIASIPLTVGF